MSMPTQLPRHPYIIHIPAQPDQLEGSTLRSLMERQIAKLIARDSVPEQEAWEYLGQYPVVYIVHAEDRGAKKARKKKRHIVYVGETNDIIARTRQHLLQDVKSRDDWRHIAAASNAQQYVIGSAFFNKSLTLDIENRFMHYMSSVDSVKRLNNRRTNAQGKYYTDTLLDSMFQDIWLGLHKQDPELFPAEQIILDSALFKASPFHELSDEQKDAERVVLEALRAARANGKDDLPTLVLVGGAAGTGKTVLLSHLFYRMMTESLEADEIEADAEASIPDASRPSAYILVNHDEQLHVYNQIATKLGLQKHDDEIVLKPSSFIRKYSQKEDDGKKARVVIESNGYKHYIPQGQADVVLIDEAHLLHTQGNQGYSGSNMLADVLRRAKVVVAIFDPGQILESRQRWTDEDMDRFFPKTCDASMEESDVVRFVEENMGDLPIRHTRIQLHHQFRIAANPSTVEWLEKLIQQGEIGPLPVDLGKRNPRAAERGQSEWIYEPFDLRVFDSPVALMDAIRAKAKLQADGAEGKGLSRVLATYDWPYKGKGENPDTQDFGGQWSVEMYRDGSRWHVGAPAGHARGEQANDDDYFYHPWNYQIPDTVEERKASGIVKPAWAEKPHTIDEIGSTFTIQGFDLNYAGVILGPSVTYNREKHCIEFNPKASASSKAVEKRGSKRSYAVENLRNELNVLLTRGVHGLYIFAVDPALREELLQRQRERR